MALRVFILEDEPLLAIELEQELESAGFDVVSVAASVRRGLEVVQETPFDVAVLDANLGGEYATPIAEALRANGTPFICISGYARDALPSAFADVRLLSKPFSPKQLVSALTALVPV